MTTDELIEQWHEVCKDTDYLDYTGANSPSPLRAGDALAERCRELEAKLAVAVEWVRQFGKHTPWAERALAAIDNAKAGE